MSILVIQVLVRMCNIKRTEYMSFLQPARTRWRVAMLDGKAVRLSLLGSLSGSSTTWQQCVACAPLRFLTIVVQRRITADVREYVFVSTHTILYICSMRDYSMVCTIYIYEYSPLPRKAWGAIVDVLNVQYIVIVAMVNQVRPFRSGNLRKFHRWQHSSLFASHIYCLCTNNYI